ncbi:MAG: hypothetical protein AAF518_06045 [Spirochaetota bacterium]
MRTLAIYHLCILLVLLPTVLSARPFSNKGYKFYKEIQLTGTPTERLGKVEIDTQVMKRSGYTDKRLAIGKKLVPFFVQDIKESQGSSGSYKPYVLFDKLKDDNKVYVIRFPEPPRNTEYTALILNSDELYETSVSISLGRTPTDWQAEQSYNVYDYGDDKSQGGKKIEFRPGEYRYARLQFQGKQNFTFSKVIYTPKEKLAEFSTKLSLEDIRSSHNNDSNHSIFYYDNPMQKPFHRVELEFSDDAFERKITVYKMNSNKNYSYLRKSIIRQESGEAKVQKIQFRYTINSAIKLEIANEDNQALNLKSIKLFAPKQEIVFRLPYEATQKQAKLRLYYGNRYALFPKFDFYKNAKLKKQTIPSYELGKEKQNEDFGYSFVEPPVSSWIIRISFILGAVALSFFTFKIFINYSGETQAS